MGLHAISADSQTLSFHCSNPNCTFHNCQNWEPPFQCAHHDKLEYVMIPADEMRKRLAGLVGPDVLSRVSDTIITQPSTKGRKAGQTRQVHITHPEIKWTGPGVVALPMCPCGTQTFLKVTFTPEELEAPNIKIAVRDPANPTAILRIDQHPMVPRHQQLAQALTAMGKVWTPST